MAEAGMGMGMGQAEGEANHPAWILARPITTPKPLSVPSWHGVPGVALLLVPYRSVKHLRVIRAAHCPRQRCHRFWKVFLANLDCKFSRRPDIAIPHGIQPQG